MQADTLWTDARLATMTGAELANAVDGFCERIAISPSQIARVFDAARAAGLPVNLHADQLSDQGGAALAAGYGALSADHLEYLDDAGIAALAASGTVATVLPGAFYLMREHQVLPVERLPAAGVPVALATDCHPSTSALTSILLVLNLTATLFWRTVEECLRGVTLNAARALGLADQVGTLTPGKACDRAIWDIERPAELVYRIGYNPLHARVQDGRWID